MPNEQEHFKYKIKELPVSFIPEDIIVPYALQKNDTNGVANL